MQRNKVGYQCARLRPSFSNEVLLMFRSNGREAEFNMRILNFCFPGCLSPLEVLDSFKSVLGISRKSFDFMCSLIQDDLMSKTGNFTFSNGVSLSLHDQVAVALRRLSMGDLLITTGDFFGVGHSAVFQVTWHFIEALEAKALHHLKWPSTNE